MAWIGLAFLLVIAWIGTVASGCYQSKLDWTSSENVQGGFACADIIGQGSKWINRLFE